MDLSFNISGAGPLSQISAHIISFDTAVFLASGAIGWWKARERSRSLSESLSACKTSLISTSSFDYITYREIRKSGFVQGLAVEQGILRKISVGIESTAVSQSPGLDCLRALTTGLLCLYSTQLTSTILADLIPYGLLQSDQEDDIPKFDGPLFASLSDWVKAVAAEEDCNNFRQHLLQGAFQLCRDITGMDALHPTLEEEYDELGLLLGCLRWMITPKHRRDWLKYPTRSIRVWTTAAVMSKLGFSITVSPKVVHSKEEYNAFVQPPHEDDFPDVALVASSVGNADPWIVTNNAVRSLKLRPQIIPLLSIPDVAFGRLQKQYKMINAAELIEICRVCFRHAKSGVTRPTLSRGGKVLLKPKSSDFKVFRENHKALIGLWSPHLSWIMRPAFDDYVPKILDENWSPATIKSFFERQSNGEVMNFEETELICNVYKLTAIFLGTIYGACSVALCAQVPDDTAEPLGDEALEVAFSPDVILSNKLSDWASKLGFALGGLLEQSGWVGLLLELVAGIEHPQPLDEQPSAGLLGRRLNLIQEGALNMSHLRVTDVFGVQANGVSAIAEFIVRPSTNAASCLFFHVGIGRILNLPVDDSGYIRSSNVKMPTSELHLDPEPNLERLFLTSEPEPASALRIDAEPDWMNNPQTICFAVRKSGTVVATLNIPQLLEKLINCTIDCKCSNPLSEVSVARSDRWQTVSIHQLLRPNIPEASKCSAFIRDQDRIVINVGGDDTCRAYAAGILSCRRMAICRDCILCAYKRTRDSNNNAIPGSAALIIG